MDIRCGADAAGLFSLPDGLAFCNHGSFGLTPTVILDAAAQYREQIEHNPVVGTYYGAQPLILDAEVAVGNFLGADQAVFVTNATTGMQEALWAACRKVGGHDTTVFITDYAYPAVRNIANAVCRLTRTNLTIVDLPTRMYDMKQAERLLLSSIDANTSAHAIVVVDQIISATGAVLCTDELVDELRRRNATIVVDGAHSPGALAAPASIVGVDGADMWVGNLHKWAYSIRPTANLVAAPKWQPHLQPTVVSNHAREGFVSEHNYQGTTDPTGWILAPYALEFADLFGGWKVIATHQRTLLNYAQTTLCNAWNTAPITPIRYHPTMVAVELPARLHSFRGSMDSHIDNIRDVLRHHYNIEIAITSHHRTLMARFSAGVYNTTEDIDKVAWAVTQL